jgi:hypothetical protein
MKWPLVAIFCVTTAAAWAQADLISLLAREAPLDVACRTGDRGACAEREAVLSDLHDRGWCYGPPIRENRKKSWKLCSSWSRSDR